MMDRKLIVTILATLILSACDMSEKRILPKIDESQKTSSVEVAQPLSPAETIKAIDKSLAEASKQGIGQEIEFSVNQLKYSLPAEIASKCTVVPNDEIAPEGSVACPILHITLAEIKPTWVNDVMRRAMTDDDNPKLIKFRRRLDAFARSQINDESSLSYSWSITPEYLGKHNQVAQFAVTDDLFLGGAHGMSDTKYYVFDMDLASQISMADIFNESDNVDALYKLAMTAYRQFLKNKQQLSPKEINKHLANYPLTIGENFYFGKDGLVLTYNTYELGPYAMGPVDLTIDYELLKDILRPEYLPQATS